MLGKIAPVIGARVIILAVCVRAALRHDALTPVALCRRDAGAVIITGIAILIRIAIIVTAERLWHEIRLRFRPGLLFRLLVCLMHLKLWNRFRLWLPLLDRHFSGLLHLKLF